MANVFVLFCFICAITVADVCVLLYEIFLWYAKSCFAALFLLLSKRTDIVAGVVVIGYIYTNFVCFFSSSSYLCHAH